MTMPFTSFIKWSLFGILLLLSQLAFAGATPYAAITEDGQGAVATVNPLATQAALEAFKQGGNAIDAAVSAALTLGVVDGYNSGIGGGCFALIRRANGRIEAVDGRDVAPAAAHPQMYIRDGQPDTTLSKTGALAIAVPGSLAAYDYLLRNGGQLSLDRALSPGISLAEDGFRVNQVFSQRLHRVVDRIKRFPAAAAILLNSDGAPLQSGDLLVQTDLANTYRRIAEQGISYFYGGGFAEAAEAWMQQNGGILTRADFVNYPLKIRQPLISRYRGHTLVGFPPPSSGGVHVAQILNILQSFQPAELSTAERHHLLAEAMKLAFADRAHWLGDPDYQPVPKGLIDPAYGRRLAQRIDMAKATEVPHQSIPPDAETDFFGKHTTHIAAADKAGNWVAITTTLNTTFGAKVVIPGTGVFMNNQMDDFSIQPGVPNAFGLVGAEANRIEAGKRPLSSMSPTLVLRGDQPLMTLGAAGGPMIITQVVQAIVNTLDLDMPLPEALAALRVHHQWKPDLLFTEERMSKSEQQRLAARGHKIKKRGYMGATQAIRVNEQGNFVAVAEPRVAERNSAK